MENQQLSIKTPYKINDVINDLKILERIKNKNTFIVKCLKCGKEYEIPISTLSHRKKSKIEGCKYCMTKKIPKSMFKYHSNDIIGSYKLLDRVNNREQLWKAECIKCHKIQVIRLANAKKRVTDGCSYCDGRKKLMPRGSNMKACLYTQDELSYNSYKRRIEAMNRHETIKHKEWNLSLEEYSKLIHQNCAYCGAIPEEKPHLNRKSNPNEHFTANGIDRIDSNVGYTIKNCVPCCTTCNRMKSDLTLSEWKNKMKKILNHYFNESSTTIENLEIE